MATDYSQGDYRVMAKRLQPAAEQLVALAAPTAGSLVIDIAAGTGNVARLCTARGARAIAIDRSPEQLVLGRGEIDPGITWVVADAHALPIASQVADAALSTFGLIYAEQPRLAVAEMARVCRPGGVIGLTSWVADGYQKAFSPLLHEALSTEMTHDFFAAWGTPEAIAAQLAPVVDDVQVHTGELVDRYDSVDAWWLARQPTPPMATARTVLTAAEYDELGRRMREVAGEVGEHDGGFVVRDRYLVATARVG